MKAALLAAALAFNLLSTSSAQEHLSHGSALQDELQIMASGGLFDHPTPSAVTGGFVKMRKAKRLMQRKAIARNHRRSQIYLTQPSTSCFPSALAPPSSDHLPPLDHWWCPQEKEYAFLGFTYDISHCPTSEQLVDDFSRMRRDYDSRYVRIVGACDEAPTHDAIVEAAWQAGVGVYATLWLGVGDDAKWLARMAEIMSVVRHNPKAPYVLRNIAIGSDALYDGLLSPSELAVEILSLKALLKQHKIQVAISELPYGLQEHKGAPEVLEAADVVGLHISPFFSATATEGDQAWSSIASSLAYTQSRLPTDSKPIRITQTGWPSDETLFRPNSKLAIANVFNQQAYFELLDSKCEHFKANGVGWFAHTWSDAMVSGWGLLAADGRAKYEWAARTTC